MPCTTILVGKKATYNGSTLIARTDDGPFDAKKVIITEKDKAVKVYKSVLSHLTIEMPTHNYRFTSCPSVDKYKGLWAAAGINEMNVGMNATETITTNAKVYGADPLVIYKKGKNKGGISEEDLVLLILPYIKTAREGVLRLGELLEKYGTSESNGIAFNDKDEIWWVETIGGHHFIAKRVPDDKVVIMPNQFGLDNFDFADACGEGKENLCSKDLKEFVLKNHLYQGKDIDKDFNPRLAFGSHSDQDHIYNTPRAWFILKYFAPTSYKYDGCDADFTPISDNIPWSFAPEHKVSIEEMKYILSSYYQGTIYNPYGKSNEHGKYRSIGVPNSDVTSMQEIRNGLPHEMSALEWLSLGGSGFTCMFPIYTNCTKIPSYISQTSKTVSTDYMYWSSRLIASLVDAHFAESVLFSERYQKNVLFKAYSIVHEYDEKMLQTKDFSLVDEANEKILKMVKEETDKVLKEVLNMASNKMKTRYSRGDN